MTSESKEAVFKINVPLSDNSGKAIKQSLIEGYLGTINKLFGGSTSFKTFGCYKEKKKWKCERMVTIQGARDFDTPYDQYIPQEIKVKNKPFSQYTNNEKKMQLDKDYKGIKKLADEIATTLGQDSVYIERDLVDDVGFIKGERKDTLPKNLIGKREFSFPR